MSHPSSRDRRHQGRAAGEPRDASVPRSARVWTVLAEDERRPLGRPTSIRKGNWYALGEYPARACLIVDCRMSVWLTWLGTGLHPLCDHRELDLLNRRGGAASADRVASARRMSTSS